VTEHPIQQAVDEEEMMVSSPTSSVQRISQWTHVSQMRVWITLNHHGYYPFHQQFIQALQPADYPATMEFFNW